MGAESIDSVLGTPWSEFLVHYTEAERDGQFASSPGCFANRGLQEASLLDVAMSEEIVLEGHAPSWPAGTRWRKNGSISLTMRRASLRSLRATPTYLAPSG